MVCDRRHEQRPRDAADPSDSGAFAIVGMASSSVIAQDGIDPAKRQYMAKSSPSLSMAVVAAVDEPVQAATSGAVRLKRGQAIKKRPWPARTVLTAPGRHHGYPASTSFFKAFRER